MSGGHFDYNQYRINEMADEIERLIKRNHIEDDYGYCHDYSDETIKQFTIAVTKLREAAVYVQRIDWLVCDDDGEETFHERLRKDLKNLEKA